MAGVRDVMKKELIEFSECLNLKGRIEKDDLEILNMGDLEDESKRGRIVKLGAEKCEFLVYLGVSGSLQWTVRDADCISRERSGWGDTQVTDMGITNIVSGRNQRGEHMAGGSSLLGSISINKGHQKGRNSLKELGLYSFVKNQTQF